MKLELFRHWCHANITICKNLTLLRLFLHCSVVYANGRVVQTAQYRHVAILAVFFMVSWSHDIP